MIKSLGAGVLMVSALGTALALAEIRNVVIPKDGVPFTVKANDIVRVSAQVPAGGSVKAAVDGKAKVIYESRVREVVNGKTPLGLDTYEFDIESVDDGKIVVTLTILPPTGEPSAKIYQYSVDGWDRRFDRKGADKDKGAYEYKK